MSTKKSMAITPSLREELRASIRVDAHARALMNAVTNSNLRSLALNREIMSCHTSFFSHKVEAGKVTNQNRSGRCWLFAALNILRPKIMEKHHLEDFEFSENYLFFWDKMEKANFFLESIIHFRDRALEDRKVKFLLQDPFADGGQWSFVAALVEKYGLVPRYAMDETANSRDSSVMDEVISSLLRHDAALLRDMHREGKGERELRTKKEAMLRDVYRVLVFCLGVPPDTFCLVYENRKKKISSPRTMTPLEFYRKEIGVDLGEYVCLYHDPTREYRRLYRISMDRNMVEAPDVHFINVELEPLKSYIIKSLLDKEVVWFGADVRRECDRELGVMALKLLDYEALFNIELPKTKEERILYRDSVPTHAMVFTGVDFREGKPRTWCVENSWGSERGKEGYYTLYDSWFDEYVYEAVIRRKYLPGELLALLDTDPTILAEDDAMR